MTKRGKKPKEVADINAFMHDVEELMHLERINQIWDQYKIQIIVGIVAIVFIFSGAKYWLRAEESAKLTQANMFFTMQQDQSISAEEFQNFAQQAGAGYALSAQFEAAKRLMALGDVAAAENMLMAVVRDDTQPEVYQDLARIHLGHLLVESDFEKVEETLGVLLARQSVFQLSAIELIAYIREKQGRLSDAVGLYQKITADQTAPRTLKERAQFRIEALSSKS